MRHSNSGKKLSRNPSHRKALLRNMSKALLTHGRIRTTEVKAKELREQLGIKAPTVEQLVGNLSGGNQQKALVGKWIFAQPDVLILDEPTRGVDVGAKYEIYQIINQLVAEGKAVLMISSELPELLGMSDRIYVMNEGRLIAEMPTKEASQEIIMGHIMQDSKGEIGA